MPDPFRLRVLKALTDALKEITPANGYEFDMSDAIVTEDGQTGTIPRVTRGKVIFGDNDPLPNIVILEQPQPLDQQPTQTNNPVATGPWDLLIQGFVTNDVHNPLDPAHRLMGEVKAILAKEKLRTSPINNSPDYLGLGDRKSNVIVGFSIGPGSVRPADGVTNDTAYFYLTLSLMVTENAVKPYA